ncbi:serine protease ami-like [Schistocerca americana]|uniref:serine protease ami-like n=1 Tax=Schistocerca americana TaxID=7009 RepID=UPI001F4F41FD|nr:serine protease ami-like [Schistocerca americana]
MVVVCRIAAWGALIAAVRCSLNTADEIRLGRQAVESWRRTADMSDVGWSPHARVYGGFVTHVGLYPFAAYIFILKQITTLSCSVTIVAPKWVLSAAHCVRGMHWQGIIFAGDVDFTTDRLFTKYNIQIRIVRETFDYTPPKPDQLVHDIVVVELWRELRIETGYVTTIPLTEDTRLPPNFKETCTIVGYGQRGANLKPKTGLQRAASFITEPGPTCGRTDVRENGLCTLDVEKKSSCKGDSGGPVFCAGRHVLMGIITGGRFKNCSMQWCGAPMLHNYHMFVGYYRSWILRIIQPQLSGGGQRGSGSVPLPQASASLLLVLSCAINTCPVF